MNEHLVYSRVSGVLLGFFLIIFCTKTKSNQKGNAQKWQKLIIINDKKYHLMYPKANDGFIYLPNNSDKNDELVLHTKLK